MKKYYLPIVLFALNISNISAQILTGSQSGYYHDFDPDIELHEQVSGQTSSYSLDINNDGLGDFEFISYRNSVQGGGFSSFTIYGSKIYCRGNATVLVDTGYYFSAYRCIAKPLSENVLLSQEPPEKTSWENGKDRSAGKEVYLDFLEPNQFGEFQPTVWEHTEDHYIGLRTYNDSDTTYAWVKVLLPSESHIIIKEIGSESFVTLSVTEKDSYENFKSYYTLKNLVVESSEKGECQVYDMQGNLIKKFAHSGGIEKTSLGDVSTGVLIVRMVSDKSVKTNRVLISE